MKREQGFLNQSLEYLFWSFLDKKGSLYGGSARGGYYPWRDHPSLWSYHNINVHNTQFSGLTVSIYVMSIFFKSNTIYNKGYFFRNFGKITCLFDWNQQSTHIWHCFKNSNLLRTNALFLHASYKMNTIKRCFDKIRMWT
jgi:hypothetical protein